LAGSVGILEANRKDFFLSIQDPINKPMSVKKIMKTHILVLLGLLDCFAKCALSQTADD